MAASFYRASILLALISTPGSLAGVASVLPTTSLSTSSAAAGIAARESQSVPSGFTTTTSGDALITAPAIVPKGATFDENGNEKRGEGEGDYITVTPVTLTSTWW